MKLDDLQQSTGLGAKANKSTLPSLSPTVKRNIVADARGSQFENGILFNSISKPSAKNGEIFSAKLEGQTVLIVDDSIEIRQALSRDIINLGYKAITAASNKQALHYLEDNDNDVRTVFVDLVLGHEDGLALLEVLSERWPNMRRVLMSGYVLPVTLDLVRTCGRAHAVMTKPWNRDSLTHVIVGEKIH